MRAKPSSSIMRSFPLRRYRAAIKPGAPQLLRKPPGNVIYDWTIGDEAATEAAFKSAANVVALDINHNRLVPNAMEPRAAIAEYNDAEEHFTLYTTSQNPHVARLVLSGILQHRAGAQAAGGGARCRRRFRLENLHLPEEMVALWPPRRCGAR